MLLVADELGKIVPSIDWSVMTLRGLFCYIKALATPLALPYALPLTLCNRISPKFRTRDRASGHPSFAIWIKSDGEGCLGVLLVFGDDLGQDVVDVFMANGATLHEQILILWHSFSKCLVIHRLYCFLAAKNLFSDDDCDKLFIVSMVVVHCQCILNYVELFFILPACAGEHLITYDLNRQLAGECHQVVNHPLCWAFRATYQQLVLILVIDVLLLVTHLIKKYLHLCVVCGLGTRVEDKE